jgi:GNAT superfamily N-acetyltransferase
VRTDDKALLATLVAGSSPDSLYRRFHGPKHRLTEAELRHLTEVDHRDHEALLAVDRDGAARGVARYVRLPDDAEVAEIAILVFDEWQGVGLGMSLLTELARRARIAGIRRFRAVMQSDNRRVRRLIERLGPVRVIDDRGGTAVIEVEVGGGGLRRSLVCAPRPAFGRA